MDKIIESRTKYWQGYREKIIEESRKFENPLNEKKIQKLTNSINSINPNILKDFENIEIDLANIIEINDSDDQLFFNNINFKIPGLDKNTIDTINNEMKLIDNLNKQNYILDKNGYIEIKSIDNTNSIEELTAILNQITIVRNKIQQFPSDSKQDLSKIDKLLDSAKENKKINDIKNFTLPEIKNKKNVKRIYLSLFCSLIISVVITFVIIILILVYI